MVGMTKPPLCIIREGDAVPQWPEELLYSVDAFDPRENLSRVLARVSDIDVALAAFMTAVVKFPNKRITLRDGARIIRRSDEMSR
jgi:hypothetical protein